LKWVIYELIPFLKSSIPFIVLNGDNVGYPLGKYDIPLASFSCIFMQWDQCLSLIVSLHCMIGVPQTKLNFKYWGYLIPMIFWLPCNN
jgi:hypothetical protein